jgi:hypothetical protein
MEDYIYIPVQVGEIIEIGNEKKSKERYARSDGRNENNRTHVEGNGRGELKECRVSYAVVSDRR